MVVYVTYRVPVDVEQSSVSRGPDIGLVVYPRVGIGDQTAGSRACRYTRPHGIGDQTTGAVPASGMLGEGRARAGARAGRHHLALRAGLSPVHRSGVRVGNDEFRQSERSRLGQDANARTEESHVSDHTDVVDAYMEGFRRSDRPAILALLTDDVAWVIPAFRHLTGKADFESEIVNPQFEENPTLVVDRKVEEGDTVVCIGEGRGQMKTGADFRFAFCDVLSLPQGAGRRRLVHNRGTAGV
jgi:uncharacterized protein